MDVSERTDGQKLKIFLKLFFSNPQKYVLLGAERTASVSFATFIMNDILKTTHENGIME